jgi:hypothetical protein
LRRGLLASAETESRPAKQVLFIVDRPGDPFTERLRAEIEGMGLKTIVMQADRVEQMEMAAREQHAAAAIRIVPSRRGVEIWMADETSGRSLLRQLIVDERPEGPDENLVAMQLVELLRTSLIVVAQPAPPPPPLPVEPPPRIETRAARTEPCSWCMRVQAGMGTLVSPGGGGPAVEAMLSLELTGERLGLALDLAAPLRGNRVTGPEGSADLSASRAGLAFLCRLADRHARLQSTAGLGAGILHISTDASPNAPLVVSSLAPVTMGAGYARFDAGVGFTRWLRLALRMTGGVSFGQLDIRFAGNDAGSWGRFFGAGTLVLDAGW